MRGINTVILTAVMGVALWGAPAPMAPEVIVENYWSAARNQEHSLDGASMEVEIEASLPKLKKQGRLHALIVEVRAGAGDEAHQADRPHGGPGSL